MADLLKTVAHRGEPRVKSAPPEESQAKAGTAAVDAQKALEERMNAWEQKMKAWEETAKSYPPLSCAAQANGAIPLKPEDWARPEARQREAYQYAPAPSQASADSKDVAELQAQFDKVFAPKGQPFFCNPCFTPASPDIPPSPAEARQALQRASELFSKAEKDGSLDDLVQKMRANGSLAKLARATRLDSGFNDPLSESLAKGLNGRNLRHAFTELEQHGSPMVTLDGQGKCPFAAAITQHGSAKAKSDFVGEMAYHYKSPKDRELAGPDSQAARVATASALGGLRGPDAKQAWGYLSPEQLSAMGDAPQQRASSLGAKIYAHAPLTTPYGDPTLAINQVESAMRSDPKTKAAVFEAASDLLPSLGDVDRDKLLLAMTDLLKTDVKGVTRELRERPDKGRAATQYCKAMVEPALGGFTRRGKGLINDPHIQALGGIIEELAGDPRNPGRMEDYLNLPGCEGKGTDPRQYDSRFDNAKDLFHWLGANKRAANEIAQQWKLTATGRAIQGAGFTSFAKDVISNLPKMTGPRKMVVGGGAAGVAMMVAFEARDYYQNVSADTKTAASWLRNLADADSAMLPYAQLQGRQEFNDVLNNHWE